MKTGGDIMKRGDLVRFLPDSKSGVFYLGLHGEGGVSIPAGSIGLVLETHRKNNLDVHAVDVLTNGIMGWCFIEDVEELGDETG